MRTPTLLSLSFVLLCSACGELSYKRGAGEEAFRAAQRACRGDSQPYQDCMAKQGWRTVDIAALNPGLSASPLEDNRESPRTEAEQKADLEKIAPDATVTVNSWWKFGAGPEGVAGALAECARRLQLPPPQPPKPGGTGYPVTGAQLRCMREAGWHGLINRK